MNSIKEKININKILRVIAIFLAAVIVLSAFSYFLINVLMRRIIQTKEVVPTPNIEGKTMDEALTVLSEYNLSLRKVAEKYNAEVPAGSILSQSPPPGLSVKEGRTVEAVISSGGQVVYVPKVEGESLRQAELLVRQSGLVMGEQTETYTADTPQGHIVSQNPPHGNVVEQGTYVNLVVSRGRAEEEEITQMEDLVGRNLRDASRVLERANIEIAKLQTEVNEEIPEGTILSQEPEEGTVIDENTEVKLKISRHTAKRLRPREISFYHEVSQMEDEQEIRIKLRDDLGERIVFEDVMEGGSKIEKNIMVLGETRVEIYADGVLTRRGTFVEEEEEEPEIEPEPDEGFRFRFRDFFR